MKLRVVPLTLLAAWSIGAHAQKSIVGEPIVVTTPAPIVTVDLTTGAKANTTLAARYGMNQLPRRRPQVAPEPARPPNIR